MTKLSSSLSTKSSPSLQSLLLFFLSFSSFSTLSHSSFLCDFISSTNISQFRKFTGWECDNNEPVGNVCDWTALKCSSNEVIAIDLSYRNIAGTIPNSINELSSLRHIYFDENYLHGTLPSTLGLLTNLKGIQISANRIHGSVPDLSPLSKLTSLYLNHNLLTGSLPSSLSGLKKLLYVSLSDNNFTGTIPATYENLMSQLITLDVAANQLTGDIPISFCSTNSLIYSYDNPNLVNRCLEDCLDKGCNRHPILNDFADGLIDNPRESGPS